MTEKEQYEYLLKVMTEKAMALEKENGYLQIRVDILERKLAEAEYHLNPTAENAKKLEIR